jgi:23S rRNA (cytidine1920-2'-O)/16S rRNA (cytidine1409-2'-O)-methyltransferase
MNAGYSVSLRMKSKPQPPSTSFNGPKAGSKPRKDRVDLLLVARGLAASSEQAQALLLAGQVRVKGQKVDKAGTLVPTDARIELVEQDLRYSSRGGLKLEGALEDFGVTPEGKVCVDIGSSTGGFTDCLLQNGAARVYAVDVTIDQLDWKLRKSSQVVTVERNARFLRAEDIGELAQLIVMDVSFISATKILPVLPSIAAPKADFLVLIKPQFELEKREVGRGGVVRDASLHEKAIQRVVTAAATLRLETVAVKPSRLAGAEGNQEFFLHARRQKLE